MQNLSEHIAFLIFKSLKDELSEEEMQELHHWSEAAEARKAFLAQLQESDDVLFTDLLQYLEDQQDNTAAVLYERITSQLPFSTDLPKKKPTVFGHLDWWKYAAAFILLIAGTWFFLRYRITSPGRDIVAVAKPMLDIPAPTGTKAVLTLSGGQQIPLDSAAAGMLASQGNLNVLKAADGSIVYADNGNKGSNENYNTLSVPRGSQPISVMLSDGTKVLLNAASSLKYPVAFTGDTREVSLQGEGYFEVKSVMLKEGVKKPFIVAVENPGKGSAMKVTVLGTKFNIMGYADEENIRTTLLEGAVQASANDRKVIIRPGEQADLGKDNLSFRVAKADIEEAMAWKNGEFRFQEMNVNGIMRQLSRWYNVDVVYNGAVNDVKLSGIIPKTENITQLLKILETAGKVRFSLNGNKVSVTRAK